MMRKDAPGESAAVCVQSAEEKLWEINTHGKLLNLVVLELE